MSRPDPMPTLAAVLQAQRSPDQPAASFAAIDKAVAAAIGHTLFTILIHHPALNESERFYTNMPDAYPVGGRKTTSTAPLMKLILGEGKPYIGYTRDDIVANFGDHELILSLGCESVLNMPLVWNGQAIGSMNLLHRANYYSEADIPLVRLFAALALPGALLIARQ